MAIWQKVNCLPYIRRATAERLEGDRYILTVDNSASLADVLPENTELNFDTRIYVNHEAENALSSAGGANLVEDISARYMDADTIHPAVVLYTEPGGAGEDVQVVEDNYTYNDTGCCTSRTKAQNVAKVQTALYRLQKERSTLSTARAPASPRLPSITTATAGRCAPLPMPRSAGKCMPT